MNLAKRTEAEEAICDLMDRLEGKQGGYNSSVYREMFQAMTDSDFTSYMKSLRDDPDYNLFFEIDTMGPLGTPDMTRIRRVADAMKVELTQYVAFPHKNPLNPDQPVITKTRVPKLYVPVRRLVQMLEKKNAASANIDQVNPITGQVTGDSKAASISDTQTCSLATVGLTQTTKEFLGFRADDQTAKMKAIEAIEKYGVVKNVDLNMQTKDKQAVNTMETFFLGAGLYTTFLERRDPDAVVPAKRQEKK